MNNSLKIRAWNGKRWVSHVFTHLITNGDIKHSIIAIKSDENITIQRFTGLCDNHGKEIYEGDILKNTLSGVTFQINFGIYTFFNESNDSQSGNGFFLRTKGEICFPFDHAEWCVIIGNILENPEILERKK